MKSFANWLKDSNGGELHKSALKFVFPSHSAYPERKDIPILSDFPWLQVKPDPVIQPEVKAWNSPFPDTG